MEGTMENETAAEETGEGTAGNPEEKLLPAGTASEPETSRPDAIADTGQTKRDNVPPILVLPPEDLLHGGNAVSAAQEAERVSAAANAEPESIEGMLIDRSLRESGLKEALPRENIAPSKLEAPSTDDSRGSPRIHTYAADLSREIGKRDATLSSIITAEQMRGGAPERSKMPAAPSNSGKRRIVSLSVGALVLVAIGAGAIWGAITWNAQPKQIASPAAGIIPVNARMVITEDVKTPLTTLLAAARSSAALDLGEVEALDVATGTEALAAGDLLTALGAPNELARNATGVFIGLHSFNHVQPFIIISVSAYDRAFEAMLAWEKTIGDDLGPFFAPSGAPQGIGVHAPQLSFTDHVSGNVDIRESQNAWPVFYAFPRQNLLVITTNENTLKEVMARLSLQNASTR